MDTDKSEMHYEMLRALGLILGIIPIFAGVATGISDAVIGICQSAEIKLDLSLTILPMIFTSAPVIYAVILFFLLRSKEIKSYADGFLFVTATSFTGFGGFFASYAVGKIAKSACV
ncbi:hypothetical protein COBT_003125, partial [Conglomerata obtusa]